MAESLRAEINRNTHADAAVRQQSWLLPLQVSLIFLAGFAVSFILLTSINGFTGTDDYYHTRIAAQIFEQQSLRVNFPWLPLTILSQSQFVDHHLLYHLYLAPWMHWGEVVGVKIAQSIVIGGIFAAFWLLLRAQKVQFATAWTLALLVVSSPFLYRLLMIRTQAAALLFLLIGLFLLYRKSYRWLIVLGFGFTWLYNGFILLPAVVVLNSLAIWLVERRIEWKPVAYTLVGTVLGLVINPYFPQNIAFIIDHLGEKVDIASSVRVGSEWYPYTTETLLNTSLGALVAFAGAVLARSIGKSERNAFETTLLLVALLTLYMLFHSRRFIEYFPAFSLLYGAVSLARNPLQWNSSLSTFLTKKPVRLLASGLSIGLISLLSVSPLLSIRSDLADAKDLSYMAGASAWLQENTVPGTLIFQTDWDDFTNLFYHNTQNNYLVGLDPTYLQVANPTMWNQWVAITQGLVDRPSVLIQETFNAAYVVSDTQHDAFAEKADQDPRMELVYRDANSLIWQITSESQ